MGQTAQPFFTIGIPTYNRKGLLKESIQSCLWQTFGDFELIVANDYPPEPLTMANLGFNDARVKIINHPNNIGAIANMNSLIPLAKGRYFIWLSDDDMFDPDFLKSVYTWIERAPTVKAVYTTFRSGHTYKPYSPAYQGQGIKGTGQEFLSQYLSRQHQIQGWYGVFDTAYFQHVGGMEQLGHAWFSPYSDVLLPLRAAAAGDIIFINYPFVFYRVHEGSVSAVTTDIKAYSSSQEDLLNVCESLLLMPSIARDAQKNLRLLLRWCFIEYMEVLRRSQTLSVTSLLAYWRLTHKWRRQLRGVEGFLLWVSMVRQILCLCKGIVIVAIKDKLLKGKA